MKLQVVKDWLQRLLPSSDVAPYSLVHRYECFEGTCCLNPL